MLTRIESKIFLEGSIRFHKGLNVVLGDDEGSNSIGKSTLLMIIDFVFGGNTYTSHNKDMIDKLGHHEFLYAFRFHNEDYYFIRDTKEPKFIYESNNSGEKLNPLKDIDFTRKLKELYKLEDNYLTFRSIVSTFSRVWGKTNDDIKKPLHSFPNQKFTETVTNLIKLFNCYDPIKKQDTELKTLNIKNKVLNKASKFELIPRITKRKYQQNIKRIQNLINEREKIKEKSYAPKMNFDEVVSDELIEIREEKNKLLDEKDYLMSRFNRTNKSINKNTDAGFDSLLEFFPEVNSQKLDEIESFHEGISSILTEELKKAKKELRNQLKEINKQINNLNKKQNQLINPDEEMNVFVEKLIEYTTEIKKLQEENEYYKQTHEIRTSAKESKEHLEETKTEIVNDISANINTQIKEINDTIHYDKRTAPKLNLSYNRYDYKIFDNTGTGKAYTNLILFDLAIFLLTKLPFIIHDSFLFKNIEKETVDQIIKYYNSFNKQIFIAIDLINVYSNETQEVLQKKKIIQLSKDKLLTRKDWRDTNK